MPCREGARGPGALELLRTLVWSSWRRWVAPKGGERAMRCQGWCGWASSSAKADLPAPGSPASSTGWRAPSSRSTRYSRRSCCGGSAEPAQSCRHQSGTPFAPQLLPASKQRWLGP